MSIRTEARAIALLGGPLVVNNVVQMGMQVTDTIMAGRLSATDLAAVAIGGAVWMPVFIFGLGVLMALSPTVAQLHGAGRTTDIPLWVRQGFWVALLIGLPLTLLVRSIEPFLVWAGVDPEVVPLAVAYLKAQSWGLLPAFVYMVLRFMSEGISYTRPMMYIALAALPLNALGNWVFMYHYGMGAVGCGVATALVLCAMLAMMIGNVRRRRYKSYPVFARFEAPHLHRIGELLWVGVPIGVAIFMEASLFGATALLMGRLGADTIAAHQIAVNFAGLMFMIPLGLSFAISVRVGQAVGRGDPRGVRIAGAAGILLCGSIMIVSAANILLFRSHIAGFYTNDPEVLAIASGLLVLAAVFQLSDGLQVGAAGALRGLKDTRAAMVLAMVAYWGVGFPLAWWGGIRLGFGAPAIWLGLIVGLTVAAVLLTWRFVRVSRWLTIRRCSSGPNTSRS